MTNVTPPAWYHRAMTSESLMYGVSFGILFKIATVIVAKGG